MLTKCDMLSNKVENELKAHRPGEDFFMTTPRKLTAYDLWSLKEMGNIALSPDGRRVAFVMYSLDKLKNERHSTIYLLQLDEHGHAVGEPLRP